MSASLSLIHSRALENLQSNDEEPTCGAVAHAVVEALLEEGVDLNDGLLLDQVKTLLADVGREARAQWEEQVALTS